MAEKRAQQRQSQQRQSKRRQGTPPQKGRKSRRPVRMVFTRTNYVLLLVGLVVITVGYVIMRWENKVDGFLSLYVAPIIILAGYLEIIYAIYHQPKTESEG